MITHTVSERVSIGCIIANRNGVELKAGKESCCHLIPHAHTKKSSTRNSVLYRALKIVNEPAERDRQYTLFSDSAAAIARIASDRMGPGQRFAVRSEGVV